MTSRVVICGAGFAGLELSTTLSDELSGDVDVKLIDQSESFVFGFSKLDILLGRERFEDVRRNYADISRDKIDFRRESITAIDPEARRVETETGTYEADILVVALGAAYDYGATPGFAEGGYEYYSVAGAERLRDALTEFTGGKVLVAVLGEPYKCPPAPFEGALLLHDVFEQRGMRENAEISVSGYMGAPVPVSEAVSSTIRKALGDRGITFMPKTTVIRIDVERKVADTDTGVSIPYDLFIGIPVHRVPEVVASSGLAPDGWVPVDAKNLATSFPDVYAVGDVAGLPMAKAGVFAERAARVVAADIASKVRGTQPPAPFDGAGSCYIEFGDGLVAKVEANFLGGPKPTGHIFGPSKEIAAEKQRFAEERRQRWFGG